MATDDFRGLEETDCAGCQIDGMPCVEVHLNSEMGRGLRQEETGGWFIWVWEGLLNILVMVKHITPLILHVFQEVFKE